MINTQFGIIIHINNNRNNLYNLKILKYELIQFILMSNEMKSIYKLISFINDDNCKILWNDDDINDNKIIISCNTKKINITTIQNKKISLLFSKKNKNIYIANKSIIINELCEYYWNISSINNNKNNKLNFNYTLYIFSTSYMNSINFTPFQLHTLLHDSLGFLSEMKQQLIKY